MVASDAAVTAAVPSTSARRVATGRPESAFKLLVVVVRMALIWLTGSVSASTVAFWAVANSAKSS